VPAAEARVREDCENGSDHRRYPRVDCRGFADLRVLPNGANETGSLVNLSKRGCCFMADAALRGSEGATIEIHLKVRGIDLRVAAIIRHVHRRRRAGIEFVELSERKREQIEELMGELAELTKAASRARAAARKLHQREYFPEAS
jgi:c-di-GMP-binding flagellar brake protein YcgR